jgi:predicted transposase YdaD
MKRRVARHRNKIQYEQVWISTFILMGLRYSSAFSAQLLQGVLSMKESTTYQAIIEEGRKEGRIEGLEEGREEGREEGELRALRETILDLGTQRFGVPSAAVRDTVEGQTEVTRLREIRGRVLTATGWQDLLSPGEPSPRRRGRRGK